jgi:hypothetical protein
VQLLSKENEMKLKGILVISLFLFSLGLAGYIVARVHHAQIKQGFTLQIRITDYRADGSGPIISATKTRYQKADGSWEMLTNYPNGRVDVGFGQVGRGVFHVDEKNRRLDYLSGLSPRDVTEESLRATPGFVAEEALLGFKTFHFHSTLEETGESIDSYLCPALQGYPVKVISTSKNGAKNIYEVTQVVLGEPSFVVPNYPVDMTRYEQTHGSAATTANQQPK